MFAAINTWCSIYILFSRLRRLIRHLRHHLECLKDQFLNSSTIYIGFTWNLKLMVVALSPSKVEKYLTAIHKWRKRHAHILQDVRELYSKLLHACSAAPWGRAYLTSLEDMLLINKANPFLPHRAGKTVNEDLDWWTNLLQSGGVVHSIYPATQPQNPLTFSDASSGIGIVIGSYWRAWRLILGWQTLNGKRDIGWAEVVGFKLLIYAISALPGINKNVLIHGDNTGGVEGWWKHRHCNKAINGVFQRIHNFLHHLPNHLNIVTTYVPSKSNPADNPSRGILRPLHLLLPSIDIPVELDSFIIDTTFPLSPTELWLLWDRKYTIPTANLINRTLLRQQATEWNKVSRAEEE